MGFGTCCGIGAPVFFRGSSFLTHLVNDFEKKGKVRPDEKISQPRLIIRRKKNDDPAILRSIKLRSAEIPKRKYNIRKVLVKAARPLRMFQPKWAIPLS